MRPWPLLVFLLAPILLGGATTGPAATQLQWQAPVEIARGAGQRGPWQQNESRYDFVDDPSVALRDCGKVDVVWVDQRSKDVLFQSFAPGDAAPRSATPVNVSRSPASFSWLPRIAHVPDAPQRVLVLWQEIIFSGGSHGGEMMVARSDDGGRSFGTPLNLSSSVGGDGKGRIHRDFWHNGSFDLAAGPDGKVFAVWTEFDGALWFSRSVDGGTRFTPPRQLAGGGSKAPARAPTLALGPSGRLHLAWTVGEDPGADIRVATSPDDGLSFSPPQVVAPSNQYADAPKLTVDTAGHLHLVYAQSDGGPFGRYHIRHARSLDAGRSFGPSTVVSGTVPGSAASASFAHIATDGDGRILVMWERQAAAQQRPRGLEIAISIDGGRSFAAPVPVPHSADPGGGFNGSTQGLLMKKLAVNRTGAVAIVNSSLRPNDASRVWLMRAALPRRATPAKE